MAREAGSKEIVVEVSSAEEAREAVARGASALYAPSSTIPEELKGSVKVYDEESGILTAGVRSPEDVDAIYRAAAQGARAILVELGDMRIIPLENIVARLQQTGTKLLARIKSIDEAEAMLGALERGVDGVVFRPSDMRDVSLLREMLTYLRRVELNPARVLEVVSVGMGERACVDTTSMLRMGEGMLVGNMARMLFLIHNESIGSKFTAPRPFRINAGAVHMYALSPSGSTTYLSELRAGGRVLVASTDGSTRVASIGRVKIERRPLVMVTAEVSGVRGSATLQNAETIRLVSPRGEVLDVTGLGEGDEVLVWTSGKAARHLGMEVAEYIDEV